MQIEDQSANGILEDFRIEFMRCWQILPNKGFFLALLVIWVALFQLFGNSTLGFIKSPSLLTWMYMAYKPSEMGDDGQGYAVPFVVLGLFWWKRKELLALRLNTWWPALLLVAFGLMVHFVGYMVQQPRLSIVGLFVGIYGLSGLAWGFSWLRRSFFPFALFAFCVPLGTLSQPITFPLRLMVTQIVEGFSHFISIEVIRNGTALMDPSGKYNYDVAAACSGIRSLIAIIGFSLIFGVLSTRSLWKRGILIAAAVPLAMLGNVIRLMAIVIAAEIKPEYGNMVHEGYPFGVSNLIPYIPAFLGLMWLGQYLSETPSRPDPSSLQTRTA